MVGELPSAAIRQIFLLCEWLCGPHAHEITTSHFRDTSKVTQLPCTLPSVLDSRLPFFIFLDGEVIPVFEPLPLSSVLRRL